MSVALEKVSVVDYFRPEDVLSAEGEKKDVCAKFRTKFLQDFLPEVAREQESLPGRCLRIWGSLV